MKSYWLNIPVKDVQTSKAFFSGIGLETRDGQDPEQLASVHMGSMVFCLFRNDVLSSFIQAPISDTSKGNEMIVSFDLSTKEEVDTLCEKIEEHGGKVLAGPSVMNGYYGCLFTDLDGHKYNVIVM